MYHDLANSVSSNRESLVFKRNGKEIRTQRKVLSVIVVDSELRSLKVWDFSQEQKNDDKK